MRNLPAEPSRWQTASHVLANDIPCISSVPAGSVPARHLPGDAQPGVGAAAAKGSNADSAGNAALGRQGLAGGHVPGGLHAGPARGATINTNAQSFSVLPADGGCPGPNAPYNWIGKQRPFPVSS